MNKSNLAEIIICIGVMITGGGIASYILAQLIFNVKSEISLYLIPTGLLVGIVGALFNKGAKDE